MSRIIVCGSRHYGDRARIHAALLGLAMTPRPTIVHGNCPTGADAIASVEAQKMGFTVEAHPAIWSRGRRAGPERNERMAALGADLCLAFGDGRGTRSMIAAAERHGILVTRHP